MRQHDKLFANSKAVLKKEKSFMSAQREAGKEMKTLIAVHGRFKATRLTLDHLQPHLTACIAPLDRA